MSQYLSFGHVPDLISKVDIVLDFLSVLFIPILIGVIISWTGPSSSSLILPELFKSSRDLFEAFWNSLLAVEYNGSREEVPAATAEEAVRVEDVFPVLELSDDETFQYPLVNNSSTESLLDVQFEDKPILIIPPKSRVDNGTEDLSSSDTESSQSDSPSSTETVVDFTPGVQTRRSAVHVLKEATHRRSNSKRTTSQFVRHIRTRAISLQVTPSTPFGLSTRLRDRVSALEIIPE
ncbi:hypothetical protein SISNIDRAFT_463034 [Sistotremastrum niveocremeum HHB9708]|uniref:Uncharacterized protein n=1 Tax=Sistotremastrum niveocremeum HHB9708 TaxID=1314777 RepID=A0A164YN29_9AGAM|nr:hypothetical protein SISNIDRAFT_463034 [Sistotremastrum niveocremeum HHB9708]